MNIMYYHMDEKQRDTFTTWTRADNLRSELTTGLAPHLQDWLKHTYAPAFIARNVSQVQGYKDRFQGNESEKI